MPNYDYACTACGHTLEVFQKITDNPLVQCPVCNSATLQRGVGGGLATFRFLGSGFYITDYKNKENASCCPCKDKNSCSDPS